MGEDIPEMIIEMVSGFCDEYLDDEFKALNIKLVEKLMQSHEVSLNRGKPEKWACAIIMAVGQLNFLFDYQLKPYVTQDMLCGYFKTKRQSVTIKARDIRRLLNLKLGDEEFSTEFVLSMEIPESDEDLKRIRQLDQVKFQISDSRPGDVGEIDNAQLMEMINDGCIDEKFKRLLRKSYFICFNRGEYMLMMNDGDGNFKIPLFTGIDKCREFMNVFWDARPEVWSFVGAVSYLGNEKFRGVVLNPDIDDFSVSKEIISEIYPDPDNIQYWQIFFAG